MATFEMLEANVEDIRFRRFRSAGNVRITLDAQRGVMDGYEIRLAIRGLAQDPIYNIRRLTGEVLASLTIEDLPDFVNNLVEGALHDTTRYWIDGLLGRRRAAPEPAASVMGPQQALGDPTPAEDLIAAARAALMADSPTHGSGVNYAQTLRDVYSQERLRALADRQRPLLSMLGGERAPQYGVDREALPQRLQGFAAWVPGDDRYMQNIQEAALRIAGDVTPHERKAIKRSSKTYPTRYERELEVA